MAFEDYNDRIIAEFRANDGEVAHFGRDLVLVHHVGAKSGIERVSPLMGIRVDDDTWLIAASKAGAPSHPAWYHNLLAHPEVLIETADAGTVAVRARELIGYDPCTPFDVGLQRTIQWFHDNWGNIQASARFGPGVSSAVREVIGMSQ